MAEIDRSSLWPYGETRPVRCCRVDRSLCLGWVLLTEAAIKLGNAMSISRRWRQSA
jgi:hypothetical protein